MAIAELHRAERHALRAAEACKELVARLHAGEAAEAAEAADKKDQEPGPDDVTEQERDDMHMRAALNVFMSNGSSDSLPDSTLLGISGAELRELLGGAD